MKAYKKVSLIAAAITGFFIFYISSISFSPISTHGFSYITLIYHFSMFFLFSFFLLISGKFKKNYIFLILAISFVYGALDELHQFFVPGRVADFFDLGVDFAGSITSFLFLALGFRVRNLNIKWGVLNL